MDPYKETGTGSKWLTWRGCLEETLFFTHRIHVVVHLPTISGGGEHGASDSMLSEKEGFQIIVGLVYPKTLGKMVPRFLTTGVSLVKWIAAKSTIQTPLHSPQKSGKERDLSE